MRKLENSNQNTQIGIIVSTKVSKRAVVRNRLKRQLRMIFRKLLDAGRINERGWLVTATVIKKPDRKNGFSRLKGDIEKWLSGR